MPFTNEEKCGIIDLLQTEEANIPVLIQLAKSVTRNVVDIATTQGEFGYMNNNIWTYFSRHLSIRGFGLHLHPHRRLFNAAQ